MEKFGGMHAELLKWIAGVFYHTGPAPIAQPGMLARWTAGDLAAAKFYLETLDPVAYTLDDWMMVVDYLVQKYLPHDVMMNEAKWQAARASMMGRVEASMPTMSAVAAGKLSLALPFTADAIQRQFGMTVTQKAALEFGQARCCQYVTNVTDALRGKMRLAVIGWQEQRFLGVPSAIAKRDLQGTLLDLFAEANRDWRRIALTEAGENANQGFIAATPAGTQVKRMEQYHGACSFCRSMDGKVFTVVSPDKKNKDGDAEVWVGKTNVGRSSSPKKQGPSGLVARTQDELWWAAAGTFHPHCRGRWVRISPPMPGDDPKFAAWLKTHYSQGKKA